MQLVKINKKRHWSCRDSATPEAFFPCEFLIDRVFAFKIYFAHAKYRPAVGFSPPLQAGCVYFAMFFVRESKRISKKIPAGLVSVL